MAEKGLHYSLRYAFGNLYKPTRYILDSSRTMEIESKSPWSLAPVASVVLP